MNNYVEWTIQYIDFVENYRDLKDYDRTWQIPIFEEIDKYGCISLSYDQISNHYRDRSIDYQDQRMFRFNYVSDYRKFYTKPEDEEARIIEQIKQRLENINRRLYDTKYE